MAEEQRKQVNLNREANYGGLVDMDSHMASVGIEIPDDKNRDFKIFRHHTTAVGDDRIATMAFRWMASSPTLAEIRRNTDYSPGAEESTFALNHLLGAHGEIMVRMTATCRDGKCLLAAYIDPVS